MNELFIQPTQKTPEVIGNISEGTFSINGRCLPEDPRIFFGPIIDWLQEFYKGDAEEVNIKLQLEYFNTSSAKFVLDLFNDLHELKSKKSVSLIWMYDEDDYEMEQAGLNYKDLFGDLVELQPVQIVD